MQLLSLANRDIDPTHIVIACFDKKKCCAIEHKHLTHARIFRGMQMDGIPVVLIDPHTGEPCSCNLDDLAG
jgi:hypothetical protein